MKAKSPGWMFMMRIVKKHFTLEDLNLSDNNLVMKYRGSVCGFTPLSNSYHELLPKALRLCITKNLSHERV